MQLFHVNFIDMAFLWVIMLFPAHVNHFWEPSASNMIVDVRLYLCPNIRLHIRSIHVHAMHAYITWVHSSLNQIHGKYHTILGFVELSMQQVSLNYLVLKTHPIPWEAQDQTAARDTCTSQQTPFSFLSSYFLFLE